MKFGEFRRNFGQGGWGSLEFGSESAGQLPGGEKLELYEY